MDTKVPAWQVDIKAMPPGALKTQRYRFTAPRSISSKSGALRWGEQVRREIELGRPPPQSREGKVRAVEEKDVAAEVAEQQRLTGATVDAWCEEWEQNERGRRVKETTLEHRRLGPLLYLRRAIGSRPVSDLDARDLARVQLEMAPLKATTANLYLGIIGHCLEDARKMGLRREPLEVPKVRGDLNDDERPHFDEDEAERIIRHAQAISLEHLAVALLGLDAGLRSGEMVGLKIDDLEIDRGHFRVRRSIAVVGGERTVHPPKSGKPRTLPTSPRLAEVLSTLAAMSSDGWLLHDRKGRPAVPDRAKSLNFTTLAATGLPPSRPHKLRHTFASHALRAGVDLKTLSKLLGHADIKTTAKYVHSTEAASQGAIARLVSHRTGCHGSGTGDAGRAAP